MSTASACSAPVPVATTDPAAAPASASYVRELPASFAQERMWVLEQLSPGLPMYLMSSARRLRGRLDVAALSRSVEELFRRPRSTFAT
jgi:hypothetical protein